VSDYWNKPNRGRDADQGGADDANRPSWQRQPTPSSTPSANQSPNPSQNPSSDNPWAQPSYQQVYRPTSTSGAPGPYRPAGNGEVSERKARLTLTLFFASFGVLVVGLVVFLTVWNLRTGNDNPVSGPRVTTAEDAARAVGGIGPPPGVELGPYIETRKTALAQVTDERVAVVSLTKYTTEANARAVAGGSEILALLAAPPGGQPSVVRGDVAGWVEAQTAEARAERDEINRLIPTVKDDPEFQSFYRSEIDRLNKVISNIRPNGELVFALVVRAPAPALQELGNKAEVRLVDVGPTADPGAKPVYRGIRPEETDKANEPNTRPV
jgi:hypothetical protein